MPKIGNFIYPWGNGHYSRMMRLNNEVIADLVNSLWMFRKAFLQFFIDWWLADIVHLRILHGSDYLVV